MKTKKSEKQESLEVKTVQEYRAVCKKGDFSGEWRKNKDDATNDAINHQNTHLDHEVIVTTA